MAKLATARLFEGARLAALAAALAGCMAGGDDVPGGNTPAITSELSLGSQGAEVQALHHYLTAFGYFPNAELASTYPAWRPLVSKAPASDQIFDSQTEKAVRFLQRNMALPTSGRVDAATRAVLASPRCGTPDGIEDLDPTNKFARISPAKTWSTGTPVTWRVNNADDVTLAQLKAAATAAFATWAAETSISFSEVSSNAQITILSTTLDGVGGNSASATFNPGAGTTYAIIKIDTAETWSVATPTPYQNFDVQTMLLHEIGHALGLHHSSLSGSPRMRPTTDTGLQQRSLTIDDKLAISTKYDSAALMGSSPYGTDIAAAAVANGAVWKIGTDAFGDGKRVYKWSGSDWQSTNGGGVRIAVSPTNIPWITTASGTILRRTTANASGGSWDTIGGLLARDIAIGGAAAVFAVAKGSAGSPDGEVFWRVNSTWVSAGIWANRVTVSDSGRAWVVTSSGDVFRATDPDPNWGVWESLPRPNNYTGLTKDIGIGSGEYAWIIFDDGQKISSAVWNEQPQILAADGSVSAPFKWDWLVTPFYTSLYGNGASVAAGFDAKPFFTTGDSIILRSVK